MKIKTILVLTVAAFCSMSCDKKTNDPKGVDFAGSYNGYTLANCNYFQNMISADETVVITENTDGTATVSFTSATWGTFTITDAQASASDGLCTLSGSGQTQMGMGGNTSTNDCTFTAEIKSQTDARMEFKIPAVMGGMTIAFRTGDAPADLLLAGAYKGYTDADCSYFQDRYTDDENVKLTANGDGTVKVVFESSAWGSFQVAAATAERKDGMYTFSGSGKVAMGMGSGPATDYDFTVNGSTDAAKDSYSIVFKVPAVMGGLTITLLPGTAPTTEE